MSMLVCLLLLLPTLAQAVTYYVNKSGSDGNTCASAQANGTAARLTVRSALTCLSGGDTLMIDDGAYQEDFYLGGATGPFPSGSAGAPTIIKAINQLGVTLRNNNTVDGGPSVLWIGYPRQWITFDGLRIDAGGSVPTILAGVRFYATTLTTPASNIVFKNGEVFNSSPAHHVNLFLGKCPGCVIENNIIHDNDPGGLDVTSPPGYGFSHAMYVNGSNLLIRNNVVYNISSYGVHTFMQDTTVGTNTTVTQNIFHDIGAAGVLIEDITGAVMVSNNVFYSNSSGVLIRDRTNGATVKVYNNTCYGNALYGLGWAGAYSPIVYMINNICPINGAAGFHPPTTNSANVDTSSFVSTATGLVDLHLVVGATNAINQGINLSPDVTVDREGIVRPVGVAYDIGAYEFGGVVPPPTPIGNIGWWTFDAGSGTAAVDGSGQGFTCTMTPNAGWATGIIGPFGFAGDGSRDCRVTLTSVLKPATIGVSLWWKGGAQAQACYLLSGGEGYGLYLLPSGVLDGFIYTGTYEDARSVPLTISNNASHHLAMTKDVTGVRVWVDAAQVAFLATTNAIDYSLGPNLSIGGFAAGSDARCVGTIDQVRLYDTPLTQTAVDNLFAEQVPLPAMNVTHQAWYQAHAAPGAQVGATDTALSSPLTTPLGIRWSVHKNDPGSITEYLRPFCLVNTGSGFPAWTSALELTNSFGSLGVRYLVDSVITQGQATSVLLPTDGSTGIAGKFFVSPIDTTSPYDASQRLTMTQGQHAEVEARVEFGSPLAAGHQIQCRLYRENGADLTAWANTLTLTLTGAATARAITGPTWMGVTAQ